MVTEWLDMQKSANLATVCFFDTPLASDLTPTGWNNIFSGQANDAIVPVSSQLNGGGGTVIPGIIHTDALYRLSFNGLAELSQAVSGSSTIQSSVINLLNSSITSGSFTCPAQGGGPCTVPQLRRPR
jgi:hypothetical protein